MFTKGFVSRGAADVEVVERCCEFEAWEGREGEEEEEKVEGGGGGGIGMTLDSSAMRLGG